MMMMMMMMIIIIMIIHNVDVSLYKLFMLSMCLYK